MKCCEKTKQNKKQISSESLEQSGNECRGESGKQAYYHCEVIVSAHAETPQGRDWKQAGKLQPVTLQTTGTLSCSICCCALLLFLCLFLKSFIPHECILWQPWSYFHIVSINKQYSGYRSTAQVVSHTDDVPCSFAAFEKRVSLC